MMSRFINRPVLSIVISAIIMLLGMLALHTLPVSQYPSIAPPEVDVELEYEGANAVTVTNAAVIPTEQEINGVPNMEYMASDVGNDGVGVIQIFFKTGTNADIAAVNVQQRINNIVGELPPEVIKKGILISKQENAMLMYINIYSNDTSLDEKFIHNFANISVLPELKRVNGVGYADIIGSKEYAMRIWLKPDKMLAYNISSEDVINALNKQNIEAAPGKIGESSEMNGQSQSLQYVLLYTGRFNTKEEYENIPVKSTTDGQILKIKDVADVEFGTNYFDVKAKFNGKPAAAIMLKQLPGTNAKEVIENIKQKMAEIKKSSFLPGMDYEASYDVSRFLDASFDEVIKTLVEAFLLVTLVVFIFLQDWRTTFISVIAIPVSLIGTFTFLQLFGFTLNLITLFALVLAIGIVVDNAIVVVEAVHAKMEHSRMGARKATQLAMSEISAAIIAITLVMAAVFVPVAFMSGPTGTFFRQFSVTMAIAIVLSGISALTLTPALCAMMLKRSSHKKTKQTWVNKFFNGFNTWYANLSLHYQKLLKLVANPKLLTFAVLILFCIGAGLLGKFVPSGFIPDEDQGTFFISVTTPSGATMERTEAVIDEVRESCKNIDAIESISTADGTNILSDGTGATYGTLLVNLKDWRDRKESVDDVMEMVKQKTANIKDAKLDVFPPPAIPGYGNASGFELKIIDKTGRNDLKEMETVTNNFLADLKKRPEIGSAFTIYDASFPQYTMHIDYDKAAQKGVTAGDAMDELSTLIGSEYASNFIRFGKTYKVMVQALPQYRAKPEDILKLTVKNDSGEMVPLSAFTTLEKTYGVDQITRLNMYNSAELNGEEAAGYSSGDAIKAIQEVATQKLPKGFDIAWTGISYDEVNSGNEAIFIFIVCLVFVYLILSAQYESFLLPLPVILSLPAGIFGAFLFLQMFGLENNIYAQVAMVMLIGLLGKNAILIVEFASLKHKEGLRPFRASIEGAKVRFRPILMTSFAFIGGLIPLMFATGAGAVGNRTIGSAAAGGMLFGTVFGVIIVPGLYVIFATLSEKFASKRREEHEDEFSYKEPALL